MEDGGKEGRGLRYPRRTLEEGSIESAEDAAIKQLSLIANKYTLACC